MGVIYSSLKNWLDVPAAIKPFIRYSGSGNKQFGTAIDVLCYPVSETNVVRSRDGVELTSNSKVYIDCTETIHDLDNLVLNGTDKPILAVEAFYRKGAVDMWVVYI